MECTEEVLLSVLINLSFQKGWITENEKLRIKTPRKLEDKKMAMLDLMNSMECDDNAARLLFSMRCINDMNTTVPPEGDENRFLPKIMFKLFEKGLVTEEEMFDFEGQLQAEKNQHENTEDTCLDNVDDIRRCDNLIIVKNPLKINVVIKCILQYLNFQEVKESRLVSKEWASVGLNILIPRSKVTFDSSLRNGIAERGPINFFQVFSERNKDNRAFPFSHFKICNNNSKHLWPIEELNYFFRNQQQYITNLELSEICLVNDYRKKIPSFDIIPWISNSPMVSNSNSNTKLSINVSTQSKLSFNLNAVSNIKYLELRGCTVNLQDEIQISPINLDINCLRFSRDGNNLDKLCINDVFDFRKAKQIGLHSSKNRKVNTTLSLDLSGYHKLESLDLTEITLINWKTSNWTINELTLHGMVLSEKTLMQIKKLHFRSSSIDISDLSQSLEELKIDDIDEDAVTVSQPIVLHNLKCLQLSLTASCFSTFFQNVKCPNLVRIDFKGGDDDDDDDDVEMDLAWLTSTSVKILHLHKISIKNEESRNLNLDKLTLMNYKFSEVTQMCSNHIQAKELVLVHPRTTMATDAYVEFSKLLQSQKGFQDLGQRIYVNKFFQKQVFPKGEGLGCIDGSGLYYVYEYNLGRGIRYDEFINTWNDFSCGIVTDIILDFSEFR